MTQAAPSGETPPRLLRVEFTSLVPDLARTDLAISGSQRPLLVNSIDVRDALVPPFPEGGKRGVSVFVGPVEQFQRPELHLLWRLEQRRGRAVVAMVTGLNGKSFMPTLRSLEAHLGEPVLCPLLFLRRRQDRWDALDYLTPGSDRTMEGAKPRLRRLRQAGWEFCVDRLAQLDDSLRERYFSTLTADRQTLWQSLVQRFSESRAAALVGIAGNCLTREHLYRVLEEPLLRELVEAVHLTQGEQPSPAGWRILSKREQGETLLLLGGGTELPRQGQILQAVACTEAGRRPNLRDLCEFGIASVEETVQSQGLQAAAHWVKVQWRYRPERLMPNEWEQISALQAG